MDKEVERKTVKVACSIPNGIELPVYAPGHDDGTGTIRPRVVETIMLAGPSAVDAGTLAPDGNQIITEVDAEVWGRWVDQQKVLPSFIAAGQVVVLKEDEHDDARSV